MRKLPSYYRILIPCAESLPRAPLSKTPRRTLALLQTVISLRYVLELDCHSLYGACYQCYQTYLQGCSRLEKRADGVPTFSEKKV